MRQRAETMEHHPGELDYQDQREEEHEYQTDGLELQIFLCNVNLKLKIWFNFWFGGCFEITVREHQSKFQ